MPELRPDRGIVLGNEPHIDVAFPALRDERYQVHQKLFVIPAFRLIVIQLGLITENHNGRPRNSPRDMLMEIRLFLEVMFSNLALDQATPKSDAQILVDGRFIQRDVGDDTAALAEDFDDFPKRVESLAASDLSRDHVNHAKPGIRFLAHLTPNITDATARYNRK